MMHSRYATHGSRDNVENAHPFAVKRRDLNGEEKTVLYGCHNGIIHGTQSTAQAAGREWSVDSKEFFELLADAAYETIRALSGYGVVTFIRPDDRVIRVLRLTNNSDFIACSVIGGGMVWGSTKTIVKDALEYTGLEAETWYDSLKIGKVHRFSGSEAKETKLEEITLQSAQTDRRTSGNTTYYYGGSYAKAWDEKCWLCEEYYRHKDDCQYKAQVVPSETIKQHWAEWTDRKRKEASENDAQAKVPVRYVECEDGTFRRARQNGQLYDYAFPIYVKEKTDAGPATGPYVAVATMGEAYNVSGQFVPYWTKPKSYGALGQRVLSADEVTGAKTIPAPASTEPSMRDNSRQLALSSTTAEPVGHNGHWAYPHGISEEERREWDELHRIAPRLTEAMAKDGAHAAMSELQRLTEEADLEDAAEELEKSFVQSMVKGE